VRHTNQAVDVLLICTHAGRRWALPKGRVEPGEEAVVAAQREVKEETGVCGRPLGHITTIEYWYRPQPHILVHKSVDFYLLAYASGEPVPQAGEVDSAAWVPLSDAIRLASYPGERQVLELAARSLGHD
jgi:8-oxo-dGTP diphosphatase